jgi:hypothetical protein
MGNKWSCSIPDGSTSHWHVDLSDDNVAICVSQWKDRDSVHSVRSVSPQIIISFREMFVLSSMHFDGIRTNLVLEAAGITSHRQVKPKGCLYHR